MADYMDFLLDMDYTTRSQFTEEELAAPSLVLKGKVKQERKPGVCGKCGKRIGQGVYRHEMACLG